MAIKEMLPEVKNGYSPTAEDIKAVAEPIIKALIPKNKTKTKLKQLNAVETFELIRPFLPKSADPEILCLEILSKIDGEKIINYIDQLPKGKRLKIDHIDNLEVTMRGFAEKYSSGNGKKYLHGGGDTIRAGTNVILVRNSDGTVTISALGGSGGSTIISEILAGVQSGNNVTLTFSGLSHTATSIISIARNGKLLTPGSTSIDGYTITGVATATVYDAVDGDTFLVTYGY